MAFEESRNFVLNKHFFPQNTCQNVCWYWGIKKYQYPRLCGSRDNLRWKRVVAKKTIKKHFQVHGQLSSNGDSLILQKEKFVEISGLWLMALYRLWTTDGKETWYEYWQKDRLKSFLLKCTRRRKPSRNCSGYVNHYCWKWPTKTTLSTLKNGKGEFFQQWIYSFTLA